MFFGLLIWIDPLDEKGQQTPALPGSVQIRVKARPSPTPDTVFPTVTARITELGGRAYEGKIRSASTDFEFTSDGSFVRFVITIELDSAPSRVFTADSGPVGTAVTNALAFTREGIWVKIAVDANGEILYFDDGYFRGNILTGQ